MKGKKYKGMYIEPRPAANGLIRYRIVLGRHHKKSTGCFTYAKPKDQLQKNHNADALKILEAKLGQMLLDRGAVGSGVILKDKMESNFMDYFSGYVEKYKRDANRSLQSSFN